MQFYVALLLCGILSQVLAAPAKEEQKRQMKSLVKSPEDVENLERELKAEKEHEKKTLEKERVQPAVDDAQDGNDDVVPPEIETDEYRNFDDPIAILKELTNSDKTVWKAVRELLDYLSENPNILRMRMQRQHDKLMNELTESFADEDNTIPQSMMEFSPQLREQPKHVEKKNGYRVSHEPVSSESENSQEGDDNSAFPGNYVDMQEGGEQEEKEEQEKSDRMNKMANGVAVAEEKPGNIFMHPVPLFNKIPNENDNPSMATQDDSAEDDTNNSDSDQGDSESSESTENSEERTTGDEENNADTGKDESETGEVENGEENESHESQNSEISDDNSNETGSDLSGLSDKQIRTMLEDELADVDESELLELLLDRHKQHKKH